MRHKSRTSLEIQMRTFVRHCWSCHQDVCVIFVLESLTEDVHMQRAKESETQSLPERSRRLFLNSHAAVSKRKLIGKKRLEVRRRKIGHRNTLRTDSSSLMKSLLSTG